MTIILRALASAALAVGLLTTAPTTTDTAHGATASRAAAQRTDRKIGQALTIARHQTGDPYAAGAAGPHRFDCSGLTFYSYRKAGFRHLPRTSAAQAHFAKRIKRGAMRRGDLVFFFDGGGVYHVGVFVGFRHGHRRVLHAPYSGARVRVDRIWTDRWFAGTLRHR